MTTERPHRPFILVTNDDGIEADGIWYLAEALLEVGDVMICAPAFQQSGTGTSFTLHRDLHSERVQSRVEAIDAYQVDGTPGDAVTVGIAGRKDRAAAAALADENGARGRMDRQRAGVGNLGENADPEARRQVDLRQDGAMGTVNLAGRLDFARRLAPRPEKGMRQREDRRER